MRDYVICPLCSQKLRSLVTHITRKHGIPMEEFRKYFPDQELYCETRNEKIRKDKLGKSRPKWVREKVRKTVLATYWEPEFRKNLLKRILKYKELYKGSGNPNYGKKASDRCRRINSKLRKGKTYEEMYGRERARQIRNLYSIQRSGEKNGNWQGGLTFEEYPIDFNDKLKEEIRKRDGCLCQLCNNLQEELKRKLDVHHVDYDKENCEMDNLIALCGSCNAKVNKNREYWTKYFQEKLRKFRIKEV